MRRTRVRALGRRCQTRHSANHAGNEDQVIEDQQASLQGNRSLEGQLELRLLFAPTLQELCRRIRQLTESVNLAARQYLFFHQLTLGARLAFSHRKERMLRIHRKENGDVVVHPKRPDRQREHCGVGSAHRRGRERPPHHPRPQRYDFDRSGWHRFSRSVRSGRHCAGELRSIRPRVDHDTKQMEASAGAGLIRGKRGDISHS